MAMFFDELDRLMDSGVAVVIETSNRTTYRGVIVDVLDDFISLNSGWSIRVSSIIAVKEVADEN